MKALLYDAAGEFVGAVTTIAAELPVVLFHGDRMYVPATDGKRQPEMREVEPGERPFLLLIGGS